MQVHSLSGYKQLPLPDAGRGSGEVVWNNPPFFINHLGIFGFANEVNFHS